MRVMHARGGGIAAVCLLVVLTAGARAATIVTNLPQASVDSPLTRAPDKVQNYYLNPKPIGTRPPITAPVRPNVTPIRTVAAGGSNLGTFDIIINPDATL